MVAYLIAHAGLIFGVAFGVSEALAQIPAVKANSVFQLVQNGLKDLNAKFNS